MNHCLLRMLWLLNLYELYFSVTIVSYLTSLSIICFTLSNWIQMVICELWWSKRGCPAWWHIDFCEDKVEIVMNGDWKGNDFPSLVQQFIWDPVILDEYGRCLTPARFIMWMILQLMITILDEWFHIIVS